MVTHPERRDALVELPQLEMALDSIARLESGNRRLETENAQLLDQLTRRTCNAHTRGLDYKFLNRLLLPVSRELNK